MKNQIKEWNDLKNQEILISKKIIQTIIDKVKTVPSLEGIKPIGNGSVKCFSVPFSLLNKSHNWSVEYYDNDIQIKELERMINSCDNNLLKIQEKLIKLLKDKKIYKSPSYSIYLNENILKAIEEVLDAF